MRVWYEVSTSRADFQTFRACVLWYVHPQVMYLDQQEVRMWQKLLCRRDIHVASIHPSGWERGFENRYCLFRSGLQATRPIIRSGSEVLWSLLCMWSMTVESVLSTLRNRPVWVSISLAREPVIDAARFTTMVASDDHDVMGNTCRKTDGMELQQL